MALLNTIQTGVVIRSASSSPTTACIAKRRRTALLSAASKHTPLTCRYCNVLNLQSLRLDTPACEQVLHFNNAGSSLSPRCVTDAVIAHLQREQEIGGYEAAAEAELLQQQFYTATAALLHCQPGEIAFVENATRAWELALSSLALQAGDEIITFESEYASNYMGLLHLARQKQLVLKVAPFNKTGEVDLTALEKLIGPKTRVIALTHVASQRGDIQPAPEVGAIAKQHGLIYLLDACQSAGQIDLDVGQLGCHFLAGTGRKYLRGPRGTGFLFVADSVLERVDPVFVDLHSGQWDSLQSFSWQAGAKRFETFERHLAGMIGLGVAVAYANRLGIHAIQERIRSLAGELRSRLAILEGVRVHERSVRASGIVTFSSERESAEQIKSRLRNHGINVSIGKSSNAQLDLAREGIAAVVRASVHYYNSEQEIERFIALLADQ